MINIKVERTSKGVEVSAEFKVKGNRMDCIEEFGGVISALRQADENLYLLASMADTEKAIEELEHGDKK